MLPSRSRFEHTHYSRVQTDVIEKSKAYNFPERNQDTDTVNMYKIFNEICMCVYEIRERTYCEVFGRSVYDDRSRGFGLGLEEASRLLQNSNK